MSRRVYLPGPAPVPSLAWRCVQAATLFACLGAFGAGLPLLRALLFGKV